MNILITGATGFIGSHLADTILKKGDYVRILARKDFTPEWDTGCLEIFRGDLTDVSSLKGIAEEIDVVYHLASILGPTNIPLSDYLKVNAQGTKNILKVCENASIKVFVHCSSVGVLGDIANPPANEAYPLNPSDEYEFSKAEGEKIAMDYAQKGFPVIIVRPTWVYGPGDRRTYKLFKAIKDKRFIMVGDGRTLEHPVFVKDIVGGLQLCAERFKNPGEIYTLGGDRVLSIAELCNMIAEELNVNLPPVKIPVWIAKAVAQMAEILYKPLSKEPPISMRKVNFFLKSRAYSIKKAQDELGYEPKVSLREGIQQTIRWYKERGYL